MIRKALPLLTLAAALAACGGSEEEDFRDRSGPSVIEVAPADGESGIAIDTEVVVKFSESILVRKKVSRTHIEEFDFGGFVATGPDGAAVTGFITFNNDSLTFRPASALAYSTKYTFTVNERVKDLFGNPAKPFSWSFETEADRVPPTAPYSIIFPSITNQASVVIEGSMDPRSTLILDGKTSVKHPDDGLFKVTVALAEGTNVFTFSAVDDAGNESESVEISILRDSTPPAPLTTCGSAGLLWHAGLRSGCWDPPATIVWNKPKLAMGATWTPGANETAQFTLGAQGSPGCVTASCEFTGFNAASLGTSTVKLRAYTVDQAGNQSLAFERDFRYDATPPALALTGATPPIFGATLGLAATATTANAGALTFAKDAGARYFASLDGAPAAACADAATVCTVTYAGLADGPHRFAVTATDAAGNETRVTKFVTVDTLAPRVYMLPGTGATPSSMPTFHVFADEPVTTGALQLSAQALTPVSDAASRGRHWTYAPTLALTGPETAVVAVYDAVGNRTIAATTFSPTGGFAAPATAYAAFTTGGTGRDGSLTLTGLTAALTVVEYNDGGKSGTFAYAATTGASLALTLDPLSRVLGTVRAYTDDGDVAEFAALPDDPWLHGAPAVSITVNDDSAWMYGPNFASVLPTPTGFSLFTDSGFGYWFDGAGGAPEGQQLQFMSGGCAESAGHPYPTLLGLDGAWALAGIACVGAPAGVKVAKLEPAALDNATLWALWSPPESSETAFGLAVTGATFYGDADRQIAVGSPGGVGSVYLYDATSAAAPSYRLVGDESKNARFGESIAFAARHHGGKNVLAVVAPDEPAVYFFDQDIYSNQAADPMGLYRVRTPLPSNACHVSLNGRHEIVNVGNLDGDAAGSDDLVIAAWPESCIAKEVVLQIYLGGQGAAGADPIVVRQPYGSEAFMLALPRIVPLGDLNGDSRADFGFADSTGGSMARIFYGDASGVPQSRLIYPPAAVEPGWWVLAGAADVDGDARPDVISTKKSSTVGSSIQILSRP